MCYCIYYQVFIIFPVRSLEPKMLAIEQQSHFFPPEECENIY